jgi:hypothetical protein
MEQSALQCAALCECGVDNSWEQAPHHPVCPDFSAHIIVITSLLLHFDERNTQYLAGSNNSYIENFKLNLKYECILKIEFKNNAFGN